MIDQKSRDRMCELLRWLVVGKITNDEFEAHLPESYDRSIVEIFSKGAWFLYDDLREYKLSGRDSLESYEKSTVARWVLFLKTDFIKCWLRYTGPVTTALCDSRIYAN